MADSDPLVASSVRMFCARNSQREGRSLPQQGRDHLFQLGLGIPYVIKDLKDINPLNRLYATSFCCCNTVPKPEFTVLEIL